MAQHKNAARSGTFSIGGKLAIHRLGFGSMRHHRPGHLG